jgi:GntR family transcriptional regulator
MAHTHAPPGHSKLRGKLDRSSALPLYYQLKQALSESIHDHFQPGDRVPGELELCAFYDVSRSVVRQALYELEAEGTVERRRGQGTFVAERKTSEGLFQSLAGLYDEVTARGQQLYSRVLESCEVPAAPVIARELDVSAGQVVCFIERLRFVNEEPWALDRAYLPASLVPGLLKEDLSRQSLYGLLQQRYGIVLHKARRSVEAVAANDSVAKALRVSPGDPVLLLRSTAWDAEGRPVEHFSTYFRGDRSSFDVILEGRSTAQSLSFAAR